jgi:hypothetical protein
MSTTAVQEILDRIRQLPADERLLLEERLAAISEAEWRTETAEARRRASKMGLDQAHIDRAIEELRRPA